MAKRKSTLARMMDARFTFQFDRSARSDGSLTQFSVRLYPRNGELAIAWDIHGADGGIAEGLPVELLDAVREAVAAVKHRVKIEDLHEQAT